MTLTLRLSASLVLACAAGSGCGGAAADAPPAAGARAAAAPSTAAAAAPTAPATAAAGATAAATGAAGDPAAQEDRFDMLVRDDFFAGLLHQDRAALDRAMKFCEDTLARNPRHAEAMVWHGGGLIMRAGYAFQSGDREAGGKLWTQGLAEMDRAVELEPTNVGTLIPRGAVLLSVSQVVPEPDRTQLLDKGLGDYEKVLSLQKGVFDGLGSHAQSQLLYGLADGWQRRGDRSRARSYYERLQRVAGTSPYGVRARAWLAGDTKPRPMACGGCHAR